MQQMSGNCPTTNVTPSLGSTTGPGAESTTPGVNGVDLGALDRECHAEVHMRIERNRVVFTGVLQMGGRVEVTKVWERRAGPGGGWVTKTPDFIQCAEKRLGRELAEFLDGLRFPFEVANLLPRPATAASIAAREAAAQEVARA
jgi:hypothetical protein